jgi:hypothetical protein
MLDYAGCVVAISTTDPIQIHAVAHREILNAAPPMVIPHMLGTDEDTQQAAVRRDRRANPYHFVEYLPYFSIKPLYIELIYAISRFGVGLFRAIALASVIPAFGFALVMCRWTVLTKGSVGLLCAFLFVPELRVLGYGQGTDAFSLLVLLGAFLLIFGFDRISPGVTLLLASIWIRSDNSILALLVLAYLAFRGVIPVWMSAVLAAIAVATPVAISHYGGSYGWKALYSHTFKYLEMAPGEFVPTFTVSDYLHAFRNGLRTMIDGSLTVYLVLGAIGFKMVPEMRVPLLLCVAASAAHFVIFPNFEFRYYALFYVLVAISACTAFSRIPWSREAS